MRAGELEAGGGDAGPLNLARLAFCGSVQTPLPAHLPRLPREEERQ